jgi:hypothetical protein
MSSQKMKETQQLSLITVYVAITWFVFGEDKFCNAASRPRA